jgi:hypothetical protein
MAYSTYTLAEIRANIRHRLGNSIFWADTELDASLREAMRTWNALTGDWGAKHVGGDHSAYFVSLMTLTITSATRVAYRGHPLIQTSLRDLDDGKPRWQDALGTPTYWAPVALNLIAIYPHTAIHDNSLTVDGITATPILTLDTDTIDLDAGLFEVILNYCRHLLLLKLGGEEFTASEEAHKALWAYAAKDNQRIQASDRQPLAAGAKNVGLR